MSLEPPRSPRWKRRIRRILVAVALAPVVLWVVTNGLLATPWPRAWLAGKLTARTGLEASIGRAWWTPWGGVCVGDVTVLQPPPLRAVVLEPLLVVEKIRVVPSWDGLRHGKLGIGRMEVSRPRAVIPLELAASLASAGAAEPVPATAPPAVAATPAPALGEDPAAAAALATAPPADSPVSSPPAPSKAATVGTAWLVVNDASVEFRLAGAKLARVSGVTGRVPFAGAPASGNCHVGEIESLGRVLGQGWSLPIGWRSPELRCDVPELPLAGLKLRLSAAAGLVRGLPFAADLQVPGQAADGSPLFQTLRPTAGTFQARLQARGLLRFPMSWEAVAATAAERVNVTLAGQPLAFDDARASAVLQGGLLRVPEVRLTGDRVSFLGNGEVRSDGEAAGVLRVVVPPDLAEAWSKRLSFGGQAAVFQPLDTPDRRYLDLRWITFPGGQGIELGAGGPVIPAREMGKVLDGM